MAFEPVERQPLDEDAAAIEVIVGEQEENPDGSIVVTFGEDPPEDITHVTNLATVLDERDLDDIGAELVGKYKDDDLSRREWLRTYIQGLDLLGIKFEERSQPWEGACGVFHPMLAESVIRFEAQTIQEILPASGPVKTAILGELTEHKIKQSVRVQRYLNYLIMHTMSEYRSETENLLFSLPISGSAFRKIYFDPNLGRPASVFVPAEDFVVSYGTTDLSSCGRASHLIKMDANRVRKLQVAGFYRDIELPEPAADYSEVEKERNKLTGEQPSVYNDDRYSLIEMHVDYNLPGYEDPDGVNLPYVITIDKSSRKVLSIYRNWREGDPAKEKRLHFAHYKYLPGLGFYGFGLVHMIGGLSKASTSILRQLVDAGTLSNLPGGLKSRGLRIKGDSSPIMPGEFRDVDVPSGTIKDNLTFLPYKEPSNVLYQLLGDIVQEGRRFASAADVKASDMNAEAPVGTTLAILEREMKVMSAVQARIHHAMTTELKLIAGIVRDHGPQQYPYDDGEQLVSEDFSDDIDVIPVSDPNAGTMAQRIMQYQAALQLAQSAPQMYDLPLLHRQMLDVLGIQDADKVVPNKDDIKPTDPVTENMNILNGKPVKAFIYQDHEAHIQVHVAAMQNPQISELVGQAPNAGAMQAAMAAHIAEHVAFAYRRKIEQELGVELPPPGESLPEDIEMRIARLAAPAAAQVTGKAQAEAQAKKNAEQQEDPILQMQKREQDIKEAKIAADNQAKMASIQADIEKHKEALDSKERIKAAELAQRAALSSKDRESKENVAGFKAGFDLMKGLIDDDNGAQNGKD